MSVSYVGRMGVKLMEGSADERDAAHFFPTEGRKIGAP
jgi:hypothetical protein